MTNANGLTASDTLVLPREPVMLQLRPSFLHPVPPPFVVHVSTPCWINEPKQDQALPELSFDKYGRPVIGHVSGSGM